MKLITKKKDIFPISAKLDRYLRYYGRGCRLPIQYDDLLRFTDAISLYDKNDQDTLWKTLSYDASEREEVDRGLLKIYAFLQAGGDLSVTRHLRVDRVDLCSYGNTKPFRIRITNNLNENFDYFYLKQADASRIYGLELEDILSPNRIGFMYFNETLVEEHVYGIPGDLFLDRYLAAPGSNKVRIAKEFVKFNERCFLRLLGDMHASNFVVDITMDFEENFYRMRAIDFDQQSYEPRKKVYLPQFYSENQKFVKLTMDCLSKETIQQYQQEERSLIKRRMQSADHRFRQLLNCMKESPLAPESHVRQLREELAEHYRDDDFLQCQTMAHILEQSLQQAIVKSHM
jgi:hypothetical protein